MKKKHDLEKYDWQKPHQSNPTGTEQAYYPNKNKDNVIKKNIKVGNLNKFIVNIIIYFFLLKYLIHKQMNSFIGTKTDIKILDKISSKNELINLKW